MGPSMWTRMRQPSRTPITTQAGTPVFCAATAIAGVVEASFPKNGTNTPFAGMRLIQQHVHALAAVDGVRDLLTAPRG